MLVLGVVRHRPADSQRSLTFDRRQGEIDRAPGNRAIDVTKAEQGPGEDPEDKGVGGAGRPAPAGGRAGPGGNPWRISLAPLDALLASALPLLFALPLVFSLPLVFIFLA